MRTGKIRLVPASQYNDSSLNPAIHDDELSFCYFDEGNILQRYHVHDYYVFCVSVVYDYRLYRDFDDADSCLVINDAEEFAERVRKATELNLRGKVLGVKNAPVIYVDPFRAEKPELPDEIYFTKHFRYAYQHEFRFVWPPRSGHSLMAFEIDLADISQIAELIARDSDQLL